MCRTSIYCRCLVTGMQLILVWVASLKDTTIQQPGRGAQARLILAQLLILLTLMSAVERPTTRESSDHRKDT